MQIFKSITTREVSYVPFGVSITQTNDKTYVTVEPRSVIYRSFNLKDMMIWSGYLDDDTKSTIEGLEGNISGHIINNLGTELELPADKENHIIYLRVGIGPNLYATGANIIVSDLSNPWSGYPEPFEYTPGIEFDNQGNLKSSIVYRRQTAAIFPLAYLTNDATQPGKSVIIGQVGNLKNYKMIQTVDYNIMMTTFNYDGNPISYGVPFMNPFFWYSSSSTS
jgi:hypothetical protein